MGESARSLGRRVSSAGAKAEGGKEINGRGGGPGGTRARGSSRANADANAADAPGRAIDAIGGARGAGGRTRIAMATTAEPAIIVRRMLPNSVGPSSSSLS